MACGVMPRRAALSRSMFDPQLQAGGLLVGVHVAQLGQLAQAVQHARRPGAQLVQVGVLQGVLVLRARAAPADAHVLHRLQEQRDAGDARQLGAQAGDDLVGGGLALVVAASASRTRCRCCRRCCLRPQSTPRAPRRGRRPPARSPSPAVRAWPSTRCPATPRRNPFSKPVSCCGNSPLGTTIAEQDGQPTVASVTSSISAAWFNTQVMPRSYPRDSPSKMRSDQR